MFRFAVLFIAISGAECFQLISKKSFDHALRSISSDHLKKSGCGLPFVPAGKCLLFDPELEGKLSGTGSLNDRINNGPNYVLPRDVTITTEVRAPSNVQLISAQHWLEHLTDDLPLNFAKPSNPVKATVLGRSKLITNDAPGDIQHVVMRLPKGMHYIEGQSLSVIPPGIDPKTNKKYSPRLYSIASTRYGDILDGNTVSLCVRRAEYYDPITNLPDPEKKGVCSNFLCDVQPGHEIDVAGPVGKTMQLPSDPNSDIIMVATGTGIAPFRGFMHRLFMEETVANHMFGGTAWLVLGVPTSGGLLYKEEIDAMLKNARPGQLKVDYAISREMKNQDGGKMYVQNIIEVNSNEFFQRLDNGASCYFCGLKGMMPPILETLEKVAQEKGLNWNDKLKTWKDNHQWHVEVY